MIYPMAKLNKSITLTLSLKDNLWMASNLEKVTTVGAKINTILADFSETSYKEKVSWRQKITSTQVSSRIIKRKV